jgi:hypothetical protein
MGMKTLFVGMLCLLTCNAMSTESKNSSEMLQLSPKQVAEKLSELVRANIINENTLVVWDIDNTLIQAGSDYEPSGAIPISPEFAEFIHATQNIGTTHIALTNASPFDTDFTFKTDTSPPTFLHTIEPQRSVGNGNKTFENLRVDGLKHIGINFELDAFREIPRELSVVKWNYKMKNIQKINEIKDIINKNGTLVTQWINSETKKEHQHILVIDLSPIADFGADPRPRHFIQSDGNLTELMCIPIFSHGIIFCNFINLYTQYYYGYLKGNILNVFIEMCSEKVGRKFSNVIFIDDTFECVENVFKVMRKIGIPCVAINLFNS